jgi:hypothetical protein
VLILLVHYDDLVPNLLSTEEAVHMRNKLQQLVKAVAEGNDNCQAMITPHGVISRRGRGWRGLSGGDDRVDLLYQGVALHALVDIGTVTCLSGQREEEEEGGDDQCGDGEWQNTPQLPCGHHSH